MTEKQTLMVIVAGGLLLWYVKDKAVEVVKTVGNAINPVNPENVFYEGVNSVGSSLSGDSEWTLGTWIYDVTNKDENFK
tara:strand:+ start:10381 stop:10617 length:237 start_codon:yes stop_codon:yes gene_type:complete